MSDSEDFLLNIDAEGLFPEENCTPLLKRKLSKSKKRNRRKKMKIPKLMPNYFIAFRLYDSLICQRIKDIQKRITDKNPLLQKAMIDVRTLHVTLAVTHLENEEIQTLQGKLQDWGESDMKAHFIEPMHLTFKGMGTFNNNVAFVKISECENYKRLCNLSVAINELLTNSGFYSENKKKFTPHLTVLKLSKQRKLLKEKKSLSDDIKVLNDCDDDFGSQDVKEIQLLSMTAKKDDSGYYKCLWERKTRDSTSNQTESETPVDIS